MIEWSEQHLMIRDAMRRFIEAEIKPRLEELEHGDTPPYDVLRKMMRTFGFDEVARMRFAKRIAREKAAEARAAGGRANETTSPEPTSPPAGLLPPQAFQVSGQLPATETS